MAKLNYICRNCVNPVCYGSTKKDFNNCIYKRNKLTENEDGRTGANIYKYFFILNNENPAATYAALFEALYTSFTGYYKAEALQEALHAAEMLIIKQFLKTHPEYRQYGEQFKQAFKIWAALFQNIRLAPNETEEQGAIDIITMIINDYMTSKGFYFDDNAPGWLKI